MQVQPQRLFHIQVVSLLQAPHPDVVHGVRIADAHDAVRSAIADHIPVRKDTLPVARFLGNAILVRGGIQPLPVDVADADDLHVLEVRERRVMNLVRARPGADKRDLELFHKDALLSPRPGP
jgi:hypothetical protein